MFKTHTQVKPQATGKWFHWKDKFSTSLREHPDFLAQVSSFFRWVKLETWAKKNQMLSQASFQHFHAISIVYKSIMRNHSIIVKTAVASQSPELTE